MASFFVLGGLCIGSVFFGHLGEVGAEQVSLEQVLDEVVDHNETWEITQMQIRRSQAARREVLGLLYPQLLVTAGITRQGGEIEDEQVGGRSIRHRHDWRGAASASLTLFDGPRYFDYWAAGALVEATQANVSWQRHLLLLEAELAFYTLAAVQREVEIAEAAIQWRRQYLEQAQAMVEAGMAIAVDVRRARIQVLEAEQALLEAQAAVGDAADGLAALLGRRPDGSLRVGFALDDVAPEVPEQSQAVSEERFDFLGRRAGVEAAEFRRRGVWWGLLPRLAVELNSQFSRVNAFNPNPLGWSLGLTASWNLYDGGARYARADAAQAEVRQLELELERDLRLADVEVEQALRQWRSASAAIDVAGEQAEVARETLEMVTARFEAGLATSLEVSDASQELLRTELGLNQVQLQARLAEVRYRYLRDEGLPEEGGQ